MEPVFAGRAGGETEHKFGEGTLLTAGKNLAAMQVDNRLDDIQSQTDAGLIQPSGLVGFVEPVEQAGQLVAGDAVAGVFDADIGLSGFFPAGEFQKAAGVDKFDCVVHQIVNHLMNQILGLCLVFKIFHKLRSCYNIYSI